MYDWSWDPRVIPHLDNCLRLAEADLISSDNESLAGSYLHLRRVYSNHGRHSDARQTVERAITVMMKSESPKLPRVLALEAALAVNRRDCVMLTEAERLIRQLLARVPKELCSDDPLALVVEGELGVLHRDVGNFEEAQVTLSRVLRASRNAPERSGYDLPYYVASASGMTRRHCVGKTWQLATNCMGQSTQERCLLSCFWANATSCVTAWLRQRQ